MINYFSPLLWSAYIDSMWVVLTQKRNKQSSFELEQIIDN